MQRFYATPLGKPYLLSPLLTPPTLFQDTGISLLAIILTGWGKIMNKNIQKLKRFQNKESKRQLINFYVDQYQLIYT